MLRMWVTNGAQQEQNHRYRPLFSKPRTICLRTALKMFLSVTSAPQIFGTSAQLVSSCWLQIGCFSLPVSGLASMSRASPTWTEAHSQAV